MRLGVHFGHADLELAGCPLRLGRHSLHSPIARSGCRIHADRCMLCGVLTRCGHSRGVLFRGVLSRLQPIGVVSRDGEEHPIKIALLLRQLCFRTSLRRRRRRPLLSAQGRRIDPLGH
jgi:hypothetical protein